MTAKDVTDLVEVGDIDDEIAPLMRCICGANWGNWEGPFLGICPDEPATCPKCGRKFYIAIELRVFEVEP